MLVEVLGYRRPVGQDNASRRVLNDRKSVERRNRACRRCPDLLANTLDVGIFDPYGLVRKTLVVQSVTGI